MQIQLAPLKGLTLMKVKQQNYRLDVMKSINRFIPVFITTFALVLTGCQSNSKDERYNDMTPTEIYQDGVKKVNKKHYTEAVEDFEALEARYPFGDYADKAQFGVIYSLYMNQDYASALPAVERFIRMYPRHPHVDYAYYMKGLIHYSEAEGMFGKYLPNDRSERDPTSLRKSYNAFKAVVTAFPRSRYTPDAKLRMVYLRNVLADNELVAGNFYYKKGAYLAAANRANYVLANFDQSPAIPAALALMVKAYRKLDQPILAQDAYQILAINYPQSPYIEELG